MTKIVNVKGVDFPVHTLKDGRTLAITSKHGYKFSDGTDCMDIKDGDGIESFDYVGTLEVKMPKRTKRFKPFKVSESRPIPTMKAIKMLDALQKCSEIDGVIVSYLMVTALHNMGVRERYGKVMGYNSTPETARSLSPHDKVVDIDNWVW